MSNIQVHFMNQRDDWETPQELYDTLNKEFHFTVDLAATAENTKHYRFYSPDNDSLAQNWNGEKGFCNPPYGRKIGMFVKKASEIFNGTVVMLLPARTDTRWFHNYIYCNCGANVEIRFLKGRIKFSGRKNSAPFPSMIVVFKGITSVS